MVAIDAYRGYLGFNEIAPSVVSVDFDALENYAPGIHPEDLRALRLHIVCASDQVHVISGAIVTATGDKAMFNDAVDILPLSAVC